MNREEYIQYIIKAFEDNDLSSYINESKAEKLYDLYHILIDTNKTTNLTAITDEKDVILKHFIDSASVCDCFANGTSVIDVGCGAGFPSLPLAILRPDLTIASIDSTGKKIAFVNETAQKLGLSNIDAVCTRAEDYVKELRESFDACTSRAVARLNVLSELCIPFVKIGGLFVAMKSEKGDEELFEAIGGIEKLGGKHRRTKSVMLKLDDTSINREIQIFQKTSKTPTCYPRSYSIITKRPL